MKLTEQWEITLIVKQFVRFDSFEVFIYYWTLLIENVSSLLHIIHSSLLVFLSGL